MTPHGLDTDEDDTAAVRHQQAETLHGTPPAAHVLAAIKVDSIYSDSLLDVTLVASKVFTVAIAAPVAQITIGREEPDGTLSATEKDGIFKIQFQTFDWLQELETSASQGVTGPARTYGMRFFPFIAARLHCELRCSLPVAYTIIDLPDMFRFVWYSFAATAKGVDVTNGVIIRHSYSTERSRYIIQWPVEAGCEHQFNWKVRTGGLLLLRAIHLPIYYGLIALIGTAATSFQSRALTLGAVVATWIFLLRQWIALNPPQRNTILGQLYIGAGFILAAWGLAWTFLSSYALVGLFIIVPLVLVVRSEAEHFTLDARLRLFDRWWTGRVLKADARQEAFALTEGTPTKQASDKSRRGR